MSKLLPKSFTQRGVAVAFTSPVLAYARCRRPPGESKVEYLVPGLAGNTAAYVLPYKALPEIVTLSVHDRALHEELPKLRKINPLMVRETLMKVALTGLAGPVPMRRAREAKLAQKALPAAIMVGLVRRAIQQLAADDPAVADMDEAQIGTPEGLSLARKALSNYAQGAGITSADIFSRLEDWSQLVSPVGGPEGTHAGHLYNAIVSTEDLAAQMTKWLIPEPPETAEMAQRTSLAAHESATVARGDVVELDKLAENMDRTLTDWPANRKKITERVERISNILDGWQRVAVYWQDVADRDRFVQRNVMESFAQYLPMLPADIASHAIEMWETLRRSQTRWNEAAQTKLSSHLDQGAQDKLSSLRKEAV